MSGGIYTKFARSAAEHFIHYGELMPAPSFVPQELQYPAACYVSLLENPGKFIRAMYGQPIPRQNSLIQEIIHNTSAAVAGAGSRIIRRIDLSYLTYAVAILGSLERINGASHLDPSVYGLYVRSDRDKFATILPGRPGIESGEDQIATAMRESAIDTRQEAISLYRFPVTYYE